MRLVGSTWEVPECARGCQVRYRYLLADGASTWGDVALGMRDHGIMEAPPSTWLLRPEHAALEPRFASTWSPRRENPS